MYSKGRIISINDDKRSWCFGSLTLNDFYFQNFSLQNLIGCETASCGGTWMGLKQRETLNSFWVEFIINISWHNELT